MRYVLNGTLLVGRRTFYKIDDTTTTTDSGYVLLGRTKALAQQACDLLNAASPALSTSPSSSTSTSTSPSRSTSSSASASPSAAGGPVPTPPPVAAGLLQAGNLHLVGSFRVPFGGEGAKVAGTDYGFDYGGRPIIFNPKNASLFAFSHNYAYHAAELGIPASLGHGGDWRTYPVASILQPFADPFEGHRGDVGAAGESISVGGGLVVGDRLCLDAYVYYGSSKEATFFTRGLSLAPGSLSGPSLSGQFALSGVHSDFLDGYMGTIPAAWQGALGGPHVIGNGDLSIISRTSYGPALFAANLSLPGTVRPLAYYPSAHKTLGDWGTAGKNAYFNGASQLRGVVFPDGADSALVFGRHGLGDYHYGDPATGGFSDPEDGSKGDHAYPYAYYVWAYDAHDLARAAVGAINPWDVRPYAVWSLSLPCASKQHQLGGVAYDAATGRIFLSQMFVAGDSGDYPVIHVYKVQ